MARLDVLRFQVEDLAEQSARRDLHHDSGLHEIRQFIDEHRPLIQRFTDPGAMVRGFLPGGKKRNLPASGPLNGGING